MDPRFDNIQSKSRVTQPVSHFTMNCLLCSRVDVGPPSDRDHYEQDVDAYLDHLLACLNDASALGRSRKYLSKYDTDVIKRLEKAREARIRYTIYRTDTDFILLSVGSFASSPIRRGRYRQEPIEEGYVGRGKTYYHFAYSFSQRLHTRNTVVGDVMEKLVLGFQRYTRILAQMRGEEVDLLGQLARGERFILERVISEGREEEIFLAKQDQLLDAITEYQRTGSKRSRNHIEHLVHELEQLKPGFAYDLDRLDGGDYSDLDLDLDLDLPPSGGGHSGPDGPDSGPFGLPRLDAA